jgi:hypothetical protein
VIIESQKGDEIKRWLCECNRWLAKGKTEKNYFIIIYLP